MGGLAHLKLVFVKGGGGGKEGARQGRGEIRELSSASYTQSFSSEPSYEPWKDPRAASATAECHARCGQKETDDIHVPG